LGTPSPPPQVSPGRINFVVPPPTSFPFFSPPRLFFFFSFPNNYSLRLGVFAPGFSVDAPKKLDFPPFSRGKVFSHSPPPTSFPDFYSIFAARSSLLFERRPFKTDRIVILEDCLLGIPLGLYGSFFHMVSLPLRRRWEDFFLVRHLTGRLRSPLPRTNFSPLFSSPLAIFPSVLRCPFTPVGGRWFYQRLLTARRRGGSFLL